MVIASADRGRSWRSIAGDLPERHIVWSIVQDHVKKDLLFVGTEFGIFFTLDGGTRWLKLTGGVPTISFRDLEIQRREGDLVLGTFGRGFYVLDDYSPLRAVTRALLEEQAVLIPVRDASSYMETQNRKDSRGDGFFTAPNPPYGAVVTYYLKDKLLTRAERRREAEKAAEEAGATPPYPSFDELRAEDREHEPSALLTVRDADRPIVTDGCAGLAAAIQTVYPHVAHQRCWVHKMRNILDKVRKIDQEEVKRGLVRVYTAQNMKKARSAAKQWAHVWNNTYPAAVRCLQNDLDDLLTCFCIKISRRFISKNNRGIVA